MRKKRLITSQSDWEGTSLLILKISEEILLGTVAFLSSSSFTADSASVNVVGERNIVFSVGSFKVFPKAKDVEIILSSIFAVIALKIDLNSDATSRLFVSILLLMCNLLGCGLFVGLVLTNSLIPCHYLKSFFGFLQRNF